MITSNPGVVVQAREHNPDPMEILRDAGPSELDGVGRGRELPEHGSLEVRRNCRDAVRTDPACAEAAVERLAALPANLNRVRRRSGEPRVQGRSHRRGRRAPLPDRWPYTDENGSPYELYRIKLGSTARELASDAPPSEAGSPIVGIEIDEHAPILGPAHRSGDR